MRTIGLLVSMVLLGACSEAPQPDLIATDVVVNRPLPGTAMSAAYLTLRNNSERPISITRVTSNAYALVQLHETTVEDSISRMRPLPQLEIPAGGDIKLERGGRHLMLMRPTPPTDTVSLQFYDGQTLLLSVTTDYAHAQQR